MFTATRVQIATYLLGVCPFSIAFLVFLNSSVSFVITDLIGQEKSVGNAVGTLGFADELLALAACPLWGLLSDRIGVRYVCMMGYSIIALSLVLFVQAKNVYPQLLLGRLFFSLGGAAASTMVTAILPTMSFIPSPGPVASSGLSGNFESGLRSNGRAASHSITSDVTITPATFRSIQNQAPSGNESSRGTSKIAGYVGMFTGCGALLALAIFLPLPARFQKRGIRPDRALQYSYYVVAGVAFALAIICFFGLMRLHGDVVKEHIAPDDDSKNSSQSNKLAQKLSSFWRPLYTAGLAGFRHSDIGLGYLGGFVARASSVAISLFVPLLVNAAFLESGLCNVETSSPPTGLPDIQRRCPRAYVVAAELTGVSQLVALISAPIFGYASARSPVKNLPLMMACVAGIIGYPLFATQFSPDDKNTSQRIIAFVAVCLIGISQIGAIVCSLGTLSHGVLMSSAEDKLKADLTTSEEGVVNTTAEDEQDQLLDTSASKRLALPSLKGSIAGVYSFYGGAAILILTKLGGSLFDRVSTGGPFYIMTVFNVCLLLACFASGIRRVAAARIHTGT